MATKKQPEFSISLAKADESSPIGVSKTAYPSTVPMFHDPGSARLDHGVWRLWLGFLCCFAFGQWAEPPLTSDTYFHVR